MTNKSSKFKTPKKNATQIGNFIVTLEKGNFQSVKIATVNGNWNIRYRQDNPLYLWISKEIKTEEGKQILHLMFSAYYAVCNGVPDHIFLEDIIRAYQRSLDRITKANQDITGEDNQQIIQEEKAKYNNLKSNKNEIGNAI